MEIAVPAAADAAIDQRTALGVVVDATTGQPADITGGGGSGGTTPVPIVRTATLVSSSATGTTAAGCTQAGFVNTGTANATVAGGTLPPGYAVTFDASNGDTLAAIAYTATGTTLLISTVS